MKVEDQIKVGYVFKDKGGDTYKCVDVKHDVNKNSQRLIKTRFKLQRLSDGFEQWISGDLEHEVEIIQY